MPNLIRLIQIYENGNVSIEFNKPIKTDTELDYFLSEISTAFEDYDINKKEKIYYYGENEMSEKERMNKLLPHIKDWELIEKEENTTYYSRKHRAIYIAVPLKNISKDDRGDEE